MFRENRLFCITAIVLCSALLAGCNHEIDVAVQENSQAGNSVGAATLESGSEIESKFADQYPAPDRNPAGVEKRYGDQTSRTNSPDSNSPVSSARGYNGVNSLRVWRDRDLQYETSAELLEISLESKSVKLLKENGITITVPIVRLSEHDRNFLLYFVAARTGESGKIDSALVEQSR